MAGKRRALLVSTDVYKDAAFRQLTAPKADVAALGAVLADPAIGEYQVESLANSASHQVNQAIEGFFSAAGLDDLVLLYFSGHGFKDDNGRLYLITTNSRRGLLGSTAISAQFIREQLDHSRSRRKIVILDCCYAGAFPDGVARADNAVDVLERLSGHGSAIITAASAIGYAFENGSSFSAETSEAAPSVFTGALIDGLASGNADQDGDGLVGIDELYDYVFKNVKEAAPEQTPGWRGNIEGTLYIATSPRGPRPVELPAEFGDAVQHPLPSIRLAVVRDLITLCTGARPGTVMAVHAALTQLADDDSRRVAAAAQSALDSIDERVQSLGIRSKAKRPVPGHENGFAAEPETPSLGVPEGFMDAAERLLALARQTADQASTHADETLGRARGEANELLDKARGQAEQIVDDARARAEAFERDAQERHRQVMESLGAPQADMDTAARVLSTAQQTADQAIADARREADQTLDRARIEANNLLAEARSQAEQIVGDARARAEAFERDAQERHRQVMESLNVHESDMDTAARVLSIAQQTADQAIADARREADQTLDRARIEANNLLAEAHSQAEQVANDLRARAEDPYGAHRPATPGNLASLRRRVNPASDQRYPAKPDLPQGPPNAAPLSLADAVNAGYTEGWEFGGSAARDATAPWLEAVLARKPRMPSYLEAGLLQGSALPIDFLLQDEVRHALRRGFWDAMEASRSDAPHKRLNE